MDLPLPADVRARSTLLTTRYPDPAGDAALTRLISEAGPLVAELTGRAIGGAPGEEVPAYLLPLAVRVISIKAEQIDFAFNMDAAARQRVLRRGNLRGFSAGPYSESYFGPQEAVAVKALDPDKATADLLWALATEAKRAYWLALWSGKQSPGNVVTSFDWRRGRREPGVHPWDFQGGG